MDVLPLLWQFVFVLVLRVGALKNVSALLVKFPSNSVTFR